MSDEKPVKKTPAKKTESPAKAKAKTKVTVDSRDLRRKPAAAPKAAPAPTAKATAAPAPAPAPAPTPDTNPPTPEDEEERPSLLTRLDTVMRRSIEYARKYRGTPKGESMLDETIFALRKRGLSISEIAQQIGGTITVDEVERRIAANLEQFQSMSATEFRALQVARLEDVINRMWDMMNTGSEEHAKMVLLAIERLNKMFDLETERSVVEVRLVSTQQALLLVSIVDAALNVLMTDPRVAEAIPREEVDLLLAKALDTAGDILNEGQHSRIALDLKKQQAKVIDAS